MNVPGPPSRFCFGRDAVQAGSTAGLPPRLTARSWLVADHDTGQVLAAYRAHRRLPPASKLTSARAAPGMTSHRQDRVRSVSCAAVVPPAPVRTPRSLAESTPTRCGGTTAASPLDVAYGSDLLQL
ncbi:hypothetical protein ACF08O_22000 [Streptomyces paradoxus]|uniref:hypothetical protein n=1 Tax=Streptomyces paradoxus TaxID=66375 RepID=UPI00370046C5